MIYWNRTCSFLVLTCSTAPHTFDNNRWFRGLMAGNQNASGNRYKEGSASPIKSDHMVRGWHANDCKEIVEKAHPLLPPAGCPHLVRHRGRCFFQVWGSTAGTCGWLAVRPLNVAPRCKTRWMKLVSTVWPFFSIYFSHGRITNRAFFAAINLETIITTTTNREENKQMMSKLNREEYRLTKRNDSRAQAKVFPLMILADEKKI